MAVALVACSQGGEVAELEPPRETVPEDVDLSEVAADELVVVMANDLSRHSGDLDTWVPPEDEARCAAEQIVERIGGARLEALGYRPGVPGASLSALELDAAEQDVVVGAFVSCIDANESFARIVVGSGRVAPIVATCMADGLERTGQLEPIVAAWALGQPLDPFDDDGALASALAVQAGICVPSSAFDWPDLRLPGRDTVFDVTAPAGTAGSRFADDQPTTTESSP